MTTLIIQDGDKRREINYSELSDDYIEECIRGYEARYGKNFQVFYNGFDCGEASMNELTDLLDWESLVEERKARMEKVATYQKT